MSDKPEMESDLYEYYLRKLKDQKHDPTLEPVNGPGISIADFVDVVAGMGERAAQRGTFALTVRNRKRSVK